MKSKIGLNRILKNFDIKSKKFRFYCNTRAKEFIQYINWCLENFYYAHLANVLHNAWKKPRNDRGCWVRWKISQSAQQIMVKLFMLFQIVCSFNSSSFSPLWTSGVMWATIMHKFIFMLSISDNTKKLTTVEYANEQPRGKNVNN